MGHTFFVLPNKSNSSKDNPSTLFSTYRQGIYLRLPSITSIKSSTVRPSCLSIMSQLWVFYSEHIDLIMSSGRSGLDYDPLIIPIPPLGFFFNESCGGFLFNLIPKPSNSYSILFLSVRGFMESKTNRIKLQVLATPITCLPRPFPSFAPSIIPGKSSN